MDMKSLLDKYGQQIRLVSTIDDWSSPYFGAVILPYKYEQRINQTAQFKCEAKDKAVVLCPPEHNISKLDKTVHIVKVGDKTYTISEAAEIREMGRIVLTWAILKEVKDECGTN